MNPSARIALVGDYRTEVVAHRAIPPALDLASRDLGVTIDPIWIRTTELADSANLAALMGFDGIWCVPGSPYAHVEGVLSAITLARTRLIPFLGTCGGFQYALMEFFAKVLGDQEVIHGELDQDASSPLISLMTCSLVGATGTIHLVPGTHAAELYGVPEASETFHCRYGLNPERQAELESRDDLRVAGRDQDGELRIIELNDHPYFVGTLFQPERSSLQNRIHPLIRGFVAAATAKAARS